MSVHVFSDSLLSFLKDKKFRFISKFECECHELIKVIGKDESVKCDNCSLVWKINWKIGQVHSKDGFGTETRSFDRVKVKDIVFHVDKGKIFVVGKYDISKPELLAYAKSPVKDNIKDSVNLFKSFRSEFVSYLLDLSRSDVFCALPYGNPKNYDMESLLKISRILKNLSEIASDLKFLVGRVYVHHGKTQ